MVLLADCVCLFVMALECVVCARVVVEVLKRRALALKRWASDTKDWER